MTDLRQLIIDDMKPALGVTEPAAIALACAQARALPRRDFYDYQAAAGHGYAAAWRGGALEIISYP